MKFCARLSMLMPTRLACAPLRHEICCASPGKVRVGVKGEW